MSTHMGTITTPRSEVERSSMPSSPHQAGKGSRPRPIRLSEYQKNYERIFKARMQAIRECPKLRVYPENMGNVLRAVKQ